MAVEISEKQAAMLCNMVSLYYQEREAVLRERGGENAVLNDEMWLDLKDLNGKMVEAATTKQPIQIV